MQKIIVGHTVRNLVLSVVVVLASSGLPLADHGTRAKEDLPIVRGLGSLAFVRGQGRTLEEKSQEKVLELLWTIRRELDAIGSLDEFDGRHHGGSEARCKRYGQTGKASSPIASIAWISRDADHR